MPCFFLPCGLPLQCLGLPIPPKKPFWPPFCRPFRASIHANTFPGPPSVCPPTYDRLSSSTSVRSPSAQRQVFCSRIPKSWKLSQLFFSPPFPRVQFFFLSFFFSARTFRRHSFLTADHLRFARWLDHLWCPFPRRTTVPNKFSSHPKCFCRSRWCIEVEFGLRVRSPSPFSIRLPPTVDLQKDCFCYGGTTVDEFHLKFIAVSPPSHFQTGGAFTKSSQC